MSGTSKTPIKFYAGAWGVEPCPGKCGNPLRPGEYRITVPGEWRSWHVSCFENRTTPVEDASRHHPERCTVCAEPHSDGSCLL